MYKMYDTYISTVLSLRKLDQFEGMFDIVNSLKKTTYYMLYSYIKTSAFENNNLNPTTRQKSTSHNITPLNNLKHISNTFLNQ